MRVIAIDGPAGSGKSTVARRLAERLGLDYLDTGAMYRAVAFAALRRDVDPEDSARGRVARATISSIDVTDERCVVDGVDATVEIRGPEVTRAVSIVAANPGVRDEHAPAPAGVGGQARRRRDRGSRHRHGRVPRRRAQGVPDRRRPRCAPAGGRKEVTDLDYETVAADLARRDALDQGRDDSPLVEAADCGHRRHDRPHDRRGRRRPARDGSP